jgi:hypothetical protein
VEKVYVYKAGAREDGFWVERGTVFEVRCPRLKDGRVVYDHERRVINNEYMFGASETFWILDTTYED